MESELIKLVSQLGFPIVLCCYFVIKLTPEIRACRRCFVRGIQIIMKIQLYIASCIPDVDPKVIQELMTTEWEGEIDGHDQPNKPK